MKDTATPPRLLRFGVFEVDLRACELRKQGARIKLQDQPCQILSILLERPGDIVNREELRKKLWHDNTFVDFDHSLNTAIMRLREALGDSSENPRFIETLPRRGYRFIAQVEEVACPDSEKHYVPLGDSSLLSAGAQETVAQTDNLPQTATKSGGVRRALVIGVCTAVGVMFLSGLTWRFIGKASASRIDSGQLKSLVVLPLENLSGEKDQEYFADGMTDELIASLVKVRQLRVISRTSAMEYKGTHKPLSEIARELNVDAVVEGTVLRSGNRVRITAELVQVSTDRHLWAETYESQLGDVLGLQSQVASAIVNEIRINLTPEEQQRLATSRTVNGPAYEDYLKGRYYWNKRSEQGLSRAVEYFQAATTQDPRYALAYAGLADCYDLLGTTIIGAIPTKDAAAKARAAASKALDIDPTLLEAQISLASVKMNYDWDWPGAEGGLKRVIQLDSNQATAHQRYSLYLSVMGRSDESIAEINRALQLDPLSLSINFSYGWRLYLARRYDQAIQQLRTAIEMDPNFVLAHLVLGQAFEEKKMFGDAIAELQKALQISPKSPLMATALARAYATAGKRAEAKEILAQLSRESNVQYVSPFYVATVYIGLGEKDAALDWLEKAYRDRSNGLIFLNVDPELDGVRSTTRFQNLQREMGLTQ
jgi:TolB-like protein/DNA-binding winged helix-turn-helix (wHTH) protein/Tfp pilus assembly protein PilF